MKKSVFRWWLGPIGLSLILIVALPATAAPTGSAPWLPFNGSSTPAQPTLTRATDL